MSFADEGLSQQAERLIFASLHRAECHVTAARFFSYVHVFVGTIAAGLAVAAGGSAFVFRDWITGLLAILAAAGTGLVTSLRPQEQSQLHWNAATSYWALADEVYFTFRLGAAELADVADDTGSSSADDEEVEGNGSPPRPIVATPLELLRALHADYRQLESLGPPVPVRLVRKAERWMARNEEWFPPQYEKFHVWREERIKKRPRKRLSRRG